MSLTSEILSRIPDRSTKLVTVICQSASPFTVYVDGGDVAVPAKKMAGSTFNSGDSGTALWVSGTAPICFKTS